MKILLTADPELPVPPQFYGGIERIIDTLAAQYRALGHEVLLAAHAESRSLHVDKLYPWLGKSSVNKMDIWRNARCLLRIYRKERPDVIHSFSRLLYLYGLLLEPKARILQSYQRAIHPRSTQLAAWLLGKRIQFSACATHLYQGLPVQDRFSTIYNFTDTSYYIPAVAPRKDYLLFLGRLEPIKGAAEAVQLALKTNWRLIIAGNIPAGQEPYFDQYIRPYLHEGRIEYIGPVDEAQKLPLYQHAAAFLFPIQWEEPFGIVMAESLACGTPVLALNRGSVPEVIQSGYNGFTGEDMADLEAALNRFPEISRENCRNSATEQFSAAIAAKRYLEAFQTVING